jgi:sugar-specific transcriptional regulator TrmB
MLITQQKYMQIQSLLKNYGLSDKEIAVYTALIELGPSPVRALSQKSKVNRGTTYDILRSLMDQGLVSYYNTDTHQYFTAESPEKLIAGLAEKRRELGYLQQEIADNLPELKSMFEREGGRPQVRLYEGLKGIRQILEDVLTTMSASDEKQYFVYSSLSLRDDVHEAMPDFSKKRVKLGIKVQTIALGKGGDTAGLDERKWLSSETRESRATYDLLYGGKVAHISLDDYGKPVGVVIDNQGVYETQTMVFQALWDKI